MREVGLADNANRPKIEFVASSGVRRPDRNRLFTGQVEDASTQKKHTRLHPTNAEKRKRSQDNYHFTIPYVVASSSDHARTPGLKQTGASNDRNRRRPNDNLITHSEGRKKFRPLEGPATGLERH
jgi:hypothetical protein